MKMSVYSHILAEDFRLILKDQNIDFMNFKNARVLISGATGFVGSLLVRTLLFANAQFRLDMQIYGLARSKEKVEEIFGGTLAPELQFVYGDITEDFEGYLHRPDRIDYMFHTANVTTSGFMVSHPVDTIMTAVLGTQQMLRLAHEYQVKSMVYLSSMEMYGTFADTNDTDQRKKETDLGYIDPLVVRNCYPESKRLCESLCSSFHSQYRVPVKIARLAQTFGAGILPWERRIFAHICDCVIKEEDIVLHTTGRSEGNYCYSSDMIRGLLTILLKGHDAQAYNVVNEDTHTTIAEMAEMVSREVAQDKIKVVYDIPESNVYGYAADTKLWLSSERLNRLGWQPQYGLKEMYERTIADRLTAQ